MHLLLIPLTFLLSLFLYQVPIQSNSFVLDDDTSVVANPTIQSVNIPKLFNTFNTRFLPGVSFALNYKFGGIDPSWYRLTNLAIHLFNTIMVFVILRTLLLKNWVAVVASILFLVHPVNTEPINYITQRFVLMGTFFYILTVILYAKRNYWCLVSAVGAMLCKEFVVTLPVMLLLYDFYFQKVNWKRILPLFMIAMIVPLMLMRLPRELISVSSIASVESVGHKLTVDITKARQSFSRNEYFLTELRVIPTYIRLLVFPINQVFDYDFPLSKKLEGKTLAGGMFILSLIAIAIWMRNRNMVLSFGILWFFIALSVESSVIPIGHVIAEYRVYLASIGFILVVASLINCINERVALTISSVVIVVFSFLTFQRNKVWESDLTLWNDSVKKCPYNPRIYGGIGNAYLKMGDIPNATLAYEKSIEVAPYDSEGYIFMGNFYEYINHNEKSEKYFNKAIELNPTAMAYLNRGCFRLRTRDNRAWDDYNKTVKLLNNDIDSNFMYAFTQVCKG